MADESLVLQAALGYASRLWRVIPVHTAQNGSCSCRKRSQCEHIGKHPRTRNGVKDATTDEQQIHEWWRKWPDANIGIATGIGSGILVLDVDGEVGQSSLEALKVENDWNPNTYSVRTGKGQQLYFEHPGVAVKNSVSKIADHLDVRADGGYVVAPPSRHANGTQYHLLRDAPLEPLPQFLETLLRQRTMSAAGNPEPSSLEPSERALIIASPATGPQDLSVGMCVEGQRNNTLASFAGLLRWSGLQSEEIEAVLAFYNERCCVPPLSSDEVHRTAMSVGARPAMKERSSLYWFKNRPDRWQDMKVRLLTDYQRGWYACLRNASWNYAGVLPADPEKLILLAQASKPKQFLKECERVLELFTHVKLADGRFAYIDEELTRNYFECIRAAAQNADAGRKSGERRREIAAERRVGERRKQPDRRNPR